MARIHSLIKTTHAVATRSLSTSHPARSGSASAHARPFEEVPGPGGFAKLPLIGPAFLFKPFSDVPQGRMDLLARSLHKKYGPIVGLSLIGRTVFVNDVADMETVYRNEGKHPDRPQFGLMEEYFKSRGKNTLSMMKGEEWRSLRTRVQPKFMRPNVTNQYVPAQDHVASDLVASLKAETLSPEEQQDLIFRYVLESLGVFAFNKRLGALDPDAKIDPDKRRLPEAIRSLFRTLARHPAIPLYKVLPTKAFQTVSASMDFLIGQSVKNMQESFRELERLKGKGQLNKDDPNLILSLLLSDDITEQEVIMSMSELFNGGTDTTTKTIYILLYNMARFPDKQRRLAEEVRKVVGDNSHITVENLNNMPYLKACLRESLRLVFPLVPGPPRFAPYDLVLSGYKVPKGTTIFLTCDAWLHDAKNVTSPDDFIPERWLRDVSGKRQQPIPTVAFLPFGINTRNCMGRRFAEQIIYLFMVKVIQNFEVSLGAGASDIAIVYEVFPTTNKAVPFVFTPRENT